MIADEEQGLYSMACPASIIWNKVPVQLVLGFLSLRVFFVLTYSMDTVSTRRPPVKVCNSVDSKVVD